MPVGSLSSGQVAKVMEEIDKPSRSFRPARPGILNVVTLHHLSPGADVQFEMALDRQFVSGAVKAV